MKYRIIAGVFLVFCLACFTACGNGSTPLDPPNTTLADSATCNAVCVTLTDNTIASSRVSFEVGLPYAFVVTNTGKLMHDFIIKTEPQGPNPGGPYDEILYTAAAIPPGASRSFDFAFSIIAPQTAIEFATDLADAADGGVLLPVQVEHG